MGVQLRRTLHLAGVSVVLLCGSWGAKRAGAQQPIPPGRPAAPELLAGPSALRVAPGEAVTLPVRVPRGAGRDAIDVEAPSGWTVVRMRAPVAAERSARASLAEPSVHLVSLVVPDGTRAGTYVVRLRLRDRRRGRTRADSAAIHVSERRRITIRLLSAPEITPAGEPFLASFAVANEGNSDAQVRLAARGPGASRIRISLDSATLAPGEGREIHLALSTREDATRERSARVELRAHFADADSIAARAAASTKVTPRSASRSSSGPALPLRITARSATLATDGASTGGSPSLEVAGGVALGSGGRERLDVLARVTGSRQSPFAERDEYRLEYRSERLRLKAGDHFYGLSTLTEPGRGLFGFALGATAGPVEMMAFTGRDRHTASGVVEHGTRLDLRLPLGVTVGGSALALHGPDSGSVAGASARLRPSEWIEVDVEAARRIDGAAGSGRSVRLSARQPWYSLSLSHTSGDSGFVGQWRATDQSWGSLVLRPWRHVSLEGSWSDADRAPGPWSVYAGSSGSRLATIRVGGLRTSYRWRERRGGWIGERGEESVEIAARHSIGSLGLDAGAEAGRVRSTSAADRPTFWRADAGVSVRLGARSFASASADLLDGATLDAPWASRQVTAQVALRLPSIGAGELQLRALRRRRSVPDERFTVIDASLEQRLALGHIATVRIRAIAGRALVADEAIAQFEYSVPLSVPLPRRSDGGTVAGRVVDSETGRALPRMRVELGSRAVVTDASGRFVFHDVQPGRAYVTLDRRSLGSDRTVLTRETMAVTVEAGGRTMVELPVARTSRLSGQVHLLAGGMPTQDDDGPRELRRVGAVEDAVVLLVRDGQTRSTRTDETGRFDLSGLAPGRWTIVLPEASLPEHHRQDGDGVEVELAPGEHRSIELKVVPRRRSVRFVSRAELTVDDSAAAPGAARPGATDAPSQLGEDDRSRARLQGYYTVTRWDVGLADIALKVYGDARLWPKIYLASRSVVDDPDVVPVGVRLRLPLKAELTTEERAVAVHYRARWEERARDRRSPGARVPAHLQGYYTVTHWDVGLADIALKVYGDATLWPKIWLASRDLLVDPAVVTPGVRLRIPLKAPLTAAERAAMAEYGPSTPGR